MKASQRKNGLVWFKVSNHTKPFFLWLAFNAPHSPYHKPPIDLITNTGLSGTAGDINQHPKEYFKAAIEAMDTELGRLFQFLHANNLIDSTNVIFIGDNGNAVQTAQILDTLKSKGTLYNYGVHVPFIITGPGVINSNRISDALVSTTDLFSTIAELSGFNNWIDYIPLNKLPIDSKSVVPILKDESPSVRSWNFTEEFDSPSVAKYGKTIRNTNYHLLRFDNGNEELYNISQDTLENTDLLTGILTDTDIYNYHSLCDTLSALVGTNNCNTTLGTNEINKNKIDAILISNPFSDEIIVQSPFDLQNATFTLMEITGRIIKKWTSPKPNSEGKIVLSTNALEKNGIYLLNIQIDNASMVSKLVHRN